MKSENFKKFAILWRRFLTLWLSAMGLKHLSKICKYVLQSKLGYAPLVHHVIDQEQKVDIGNWYFYITESYFVNKQQLGKKHTIHIFYVTEDFYMTCISHKKYDIFLMRVQWNF